MVGSSALPAVEIDRTALTGEYVALGCEVCTREIEAVEPQAITEADQRRQEHQPGGWGENWCRG
ncbi:MAG: hypothetical protein R3D67_21160 [Hyphomicrobiaceae bacterium]